MSDLGYDQPLYVLPFDHRGSFQTKMFGWKGALSDAQTAEIADAKAVIYEGFQQALGAGVPKQKAGILVDEQFGASVLRDAAQRGITTAMPAEKSGQNEFDFEYGDDFRDHIEAFSPSFCKVLVRGNVEADAVMNARQAERLATLSDYLHQSGRKYMFELLVPATDGQLESVGGEKARYDVELRPDLMIAAIEYFQDHGVEPDVWKIEGLDRRTDCERIVAATRRDGRGRVGNIVLGRGENEQKVHEWLSVAAGVPGFIGFAVGRTTFWDALQDCRAGNATRDEASGRIAHRYQTFVDLFENPGDVR